MWAETNIESEYFGSGKIVTKKYFCSESNYFLTYVRYLNYQTFHFMNHDITFEMLFLELGSKPPENLKTLSTFPIALLSNYPDLEQKVLNP